MIPEMRFESVCHGCTDRTLGCHSTCERYIEQSAKRTAEREAMQKQKRNYSAQLDRKIEGVLRMQKRRHH